MTNRTFGIIGAVALVISILAAFLKVNHWYFPGVIGAWLLFSFLNTSKTNSINIIREKPFKFIEIYFVMFLLGCAIELMGRFLLNLWSYPLYNSLFLEFANLIFYPFILISLGETYFWINSKVKNKIFSTVVSMLIGFIIWEIPNLVSKDWIYYVPYWIVFVGWAILIVFPAYILTRFNELK